MRKNAVRTGAGLVFAATLMGCGLDQTWGDLPTGGEAQLFQGLNENLEPVDMRDLIRGKPLVLAVGSAS